MRKEEVFVTFHNQLNRNNRKNLLIDQNLSDQKKFSLQNKFYHLFLQATFAKRLRPNDRSTYLFEKRFTALFTKKSFFFKNCNDLSNKDTN